MSLKKQSFWRLAILLGLAIILFVGVPTVGGAASHSAMPSESEAQPRPALALPSYPYGVQILDASNAANFATAKGLGTKWARVYLNWSQIQPTAPSATGCDNCDWTDPDALFKALADQGLIPIVTIQGNPNWVADCNAGYYPDGRFNPANLTDFGGFVSALATRYPNVQYFEFYNEPDDWTAATQPGSPPCNHRGWGGYEAEYTAMLQTAYKALHPKGAPGTGPVSQYAVFGGIAYEPWWKCPTRPKGQCFDNNFIQKVLAAAKGAKILDVMNYHFYAAFAQYHKPANILGKAVELSRANLKLRGKPFMVTEMGTPYGGGDPSNNYSHDSASDQVIKMYAQLMSGPGPTNKVNIIAGTWFPLEHFEEPVPPNPPQLWGLLDAGGTPWTLETSAFETISTELANAGYWKRITTAKGLEGYSFKLPDGSIRTVIWSNKGTTKYSIKTTSLTRVNKQGIRTTVSDNGTDDNDPRKGWIGLLVSGSPIFIEY